MATQIGIGISTKLDSFLAGKEAAKSAFSQLGRKSPHILNVFISPIFEQFEVIKGIRSVIANAPLVGCSAAGSITSFGCFRSSVTVCAIVSDSINFSYGLGGKLSKNTRLAGREAARQSNDQSNALRQSYIMFYDCLHGNGTDVLRGAQEILGTSFPIIGGSASDELKFQKTYQYLNNSIYTDSVVGFLISGTVKTGIGKAHGWRPIGKPHKITKANSNIIKTIDKRPAVELYEEYLGKDIDELKIEGMGKLGSNYPLGIRVKEKEEYIIRMPLKIEKDGGLILSAEIPEHEDINLMIGDKNSVLAAVREACLEALETIPKSKIKFAIVFSDVARLHLLRKDSQKESEIIKEILGENVPFFGCYTYSEYGPFYIEGYKGQSYLHNQAISIAVFSEFL